MNAASERASDIEILATLRAGTYSVITYSVRNLGRYYTTIEVLEEWTDEQAAQDDLENAGIGASRVGCLDESDEPESWPLILTEPNNIISIQIIAPNADMVPGIALHNSDDSELHKSVHPTQHELQSNLAGLDQISLPAGPYVMRAFSVRRAGCYELKVFEGETPYYRAIEVQSWIEGESSPIPSDTPPFLSSTKVQADADKVAGILGEVCDCFGYYGHQNQNWRKRECTWLRHVGDLRHRSQQADRDNNGLHRRRTNCDTNTR